MRFADDIALVAGSGDELEDMLEELSERGEEASLKIDLEKSKNFVEQTGHCGDKWKKMEQVEEIEYLGQIIKFNKTKNLELDLRIANA